MRSSPRAIQRCAVAVCTSVYHSTHYITNCRQRTTATRIPEIHKDQRSQSPAVLHTLHSTAAAPALISTQEPIVRRIRREPPIVRHLSHSPQFNTSTPGTPTIATALPSRPLHATPRSIIAAPARTERNGTEKRASPPSLTERKIRGTFRKGTQYRELHCVPLAILLIYYSAIPVRE